jgi:hypothetical protein
MSAFEGKADIDQPFLTDLNLCVYAQAPQRTAPGALAAFSLKTTRRANHCFTGLGQILRDLLGGASGPTRAPQPSGQPREMKDLSDLTKQLGAMDSVGEKVFGDRFEVGRDIEQDHVDNIQRVFDRFFGAR